MGNNTMAMLAVAQVITFFHLSIGGMFLYDSPEVIRAYKTIGTPSSDMVFGWAILGILSSKGLLLAAYKEFLDNWTSWVENLGLLCAYAVVSAMFGANLWFEFTTGFYSALEHGFLFFSITAISTAVLMKEALYWGLMTFANWRRRK